MKPDRVLSLGSVTLPNAPRVVTCLNLSQAAEGRCWGHPARTRHSALSGPQQTREGGSGDAVQLAAGGSGDAGTPRSASCRWQILPRGESDCICSRKSCQGSARCKKAFKGHAQERLGAPCAGRGGLNGLQVARRPLLSVQGQIPHPFFRGESSYPELRETTAAPSVPRVCRAEQT